MNGAHCQTAMEMIENFGWTASQSMRWKPSEVQTQLTSPKIGFRKRFFCTTAFTVGITKNGAIISDRATPRSGNVRFRSRANASPKKSEPPTIAPVISSVLTIAVRKIASCVSS